MSAAQILVVEDEFLIRLALAESLAGAGFAVIEAGDGVEALQALAAAPGVALLLTDLNLPGELNGTEVARRARERRPALPVLYMTGQPMAGCPTTSPRDGFIAKPYVPSEVCAAVRRMIGR